MRTALPLFTVAIIVVAPLVLAHCVDDGTNTVVVTGDGGGDDGATADGSSSADANMSAQDGGADSQSPVDAGSKDSGPKQVFITSNLFDGKFNAVGADGGGGATAADARCMEAAAMNFSGRTFHAWIAVGTTAASARVGPGPWFVGDTSFGTLNSLTQAATPPVVPLTENGTAVTDPMTAWTGTDVNGAAPPPDGGSQTDCTDWTVSTAAGSANVGVMNGAVGFWTDSSSSPFACDSQYRIYCFEQ